MADESTAFNLVEVDSSTLYDQTIMAVSKAVGEPLYPGDERRIFIEALLGILIPLYNAINDAGRQSTLTYARGEVLDALGARLNVERLQGSPAQTRLKFTLSETREVPTIIPKGTRAKTDADVTFETSYPASIVAGRTFVEVPAVCTELGESANGIMPESVTVLIDKIPYVASVQNTTITSGGADGEEYDDEGDDRFRERIRLAVSALSTAGPEHAYEYWAKTADAGIVDVAVISEAEWIEKEYPVVHDHVYIGGDLIDPDYGVIVEEQVGNGYEFKYTDSLLDITLTDEGLKQKPTVTVRYHHRMDGRVRIVPLMEDGEDPDEDVIERIYNACNASDVRPMTDVVTVDKPTRREYEIELEYWTNPENEAAIVEMVEGEGGAIARYVADQDSRLGRAINPDMLESYIMQHPWDTSLPGAVRVDLKKPEYTVIGQGEAAKFSGVKTITHQVEQEARWDE